MVGARSLVQIANAKGLVHERYNPTMEAGELLKQALTLSDKERADLASSLIDSLDPTFDANAELAWQEEIARRLEEIESGKVKSIPWEEVRRKGKAILNGK
jgi:putative addiction module component (TIGR02574 family)